MGSALAMWRKDHSSLPEHHNYLRCANVGSTSETSWDMLYPGYVSAAAVYWCPSDTQDPKPEEKVNFGGEGSGYYTGEGSLSGSYSGSGTVEYDFTQDFNSIGMGTSEPGYPYGGPFEVCCHNPSGTTGNWAGSPGSCLNALQAMPNAPNKQEDICEKAGIWTADQASYVYMGARAINVEESRTSADMRIAGDTDHDGQVEASKPAMNENGGCTNLRNFDDREAGTGNTAEQGWDSDSIPANQFNYVGGLDEVDNHAQDGVNVLYLDWHGSFDGRSWPSPLGTLQTQNWNKIDSMP
jgi:hypothetical protein